MTPPASSLVVVARVGDDVAGVLTSADGGLRAAVERHTGGRVTVELRGGPAETAAALDRGFDDDPVWEPAPAVALLSVGPDVDAYASGAGAPSSAPAAERFGRAWRSLVVKLKAQGVRTLAFMGSTVVPGEHVSSYRGVNEPIGVFVSRLNAEVLALSVAEGISVIDVDRQIALLGGGEHVLAAARYSDAAHEAIRDDLVAVLDDYGFFGSRPLLPQVGRAAE